MINGRHGDPQTAEPRADLVGKDEGALGAVVWIRRDPAYELQHRGDAFKGQVPEREKVRRTFAFFSACVRLMAFRAVRNIVEPVPPAIIPTCLNFRTTGSDFLSGRMEKRPVEERRGPPVDAVLH